MPNLDKNASPSVPFTACNPEAPTSAAVTTVSGQVCPGGLTRQTLWIRNFGDETVFLGFDQPAVLGNGMYLRPDEGHVFAGTNGVPDRIINGIVATGTSTITVQVFNVPLSL